MSDIIQLLPDAIANQIAAGEVIQRPSSVVKELVENALDAGSKDIKVIIKDAGKTLIQVVDDGKGMSETDARMSLERHATSKLRTADDLFAIKSMGFRGEALASIAAISQLDMKTRLAADDYGTRISTHGSEVKVQEPAQCPVGTSIEVKNLFFNVPARRKFLKSDPVEFRHISDEFGRLALAHPEVAFSLHHNNSEVYLLPKGNLRQRVVGVIGKKYNDKLVPVSEETNYVAISGFVGKPEAARKKRGDQYLFVNQRFIKSPYLNHAISAGFEQIIAPENYPLYVLFLEIDPARIDVNVHPTKQQIKFEDERLIYNYLRVSIRHALGKYSVTPSLDFDQEPIFNQGARIESKSRFEQSNVEHWDKLFEGLQSGQAASQDETVVLQSKVFDEQQVEEVRSNVPFQLHNSLLISQIKSGAVVVDQQAAHERILYEKYLEIHRNAVPAVQKALFPLTLDLNPAESETFKELLTIVNSIGFEVEDFGHNTFIIHGTPAELDSAQSTSVLQEVLARFTNDLDTGMEKSERVAKALSLSTAIRRGTYLPPDERQTMIDVLFACENPYTSPSGRKCFIVLELDELLKRFNKD